MIDLLTEHNVLKLDALRMLVYKDNKKGISLLKKSLDKLKQYVSENPKTESCFAKEIKGLEIQIEHPTWSKDKIREILND